MAAIVKHVLTVVAAIAAISLVVVVSYLVGTLMNGLS